MQRKKKKEKQSGREQILFSIYFYSHYGLCVIEKWSGWTEVTVHMKTGDSLLI